MRKQRKTRLKLKAAQTNEAAQSKRQRRRPQRQNISRKVADVNMDLRKVFEPVMKIPAQGEPVQTLVCDIFGTLITPSGDLDQKIHDFLVWLKEEGFAIMLASTEPDVAKSALEKLPCSAALLEIEISDKTGVMNKLMDEQTPHAAIDDTILVWLDADIAVKPDDQRLASFLQSGAYERHL